MKRLRLMGRVVTAGAAVALLAACGGGGSASGAAPNGSAPPTGENDAAVAADGPIGGFGSVFVGGVKFDTASAKVEINDQPASEDDLDAGMVVTVFGEIDAANPDRGTATRVVMRDQIRGPISEISSDRGTMLVLDQLIMVDERTVFRGRNFDELVPGNTVSVSGYWTPDRALAATFVGWRPSDARTTMIRGEISQFNEAELRFNLGDIPVDYSAAAVIRTPDGLSNGDHVVVHGHKDPVNREFDADRITEIKRDEPPPDRPVRIQGVINEVVEPGHAYRIRETIFFVTNQTQYRNGGPGELQLGREVLVTGTGSASGRIKAKQIAFYREVDGVVQAAVESIDRERRTLTVLGGLTIYVPDDASTAQTDPGASDSPSTSNDRRFRFDDIDHGVSIRAVGDWTGTLLIAQAIHRTEFQGNRAFLGGYLDSVSADARAFELLGERVTVTSTTDFGEGSSQNFFASVREGDRVAVLGNWDGQSLVAAAVRYNVSDDPTTPTRIDRVSDRSEVAPADTSAGG